MAHVVNTKNGKRIILRNPAEKGKRFARQMSSGIVAETGEVIDALGKAYRAGYLDSRSDNAKAYNHNHGKKKINFVQDAEKSNLLNE